MPIAAWLAVKDINTEMHETLDSITTYQGEGPPGRRRVTLQVRDRRGRHWSALLWRNAVGFTVSTVRGISARASISAPWSVGRTTASAVGLESNLRLLAAD